MSSIISSAKVNKVKSSVYKARLVADFIRNNASSKKAHQILDELRFVKKKIAHDFYNLLKSCMHNAQNNHKLNMRELMVKEVYVCKDFSMRRSNIRGRGRAGSIRKPFVQLFVSVVG